MGFMQNDFDTTVLTRGDLIIAVYVDDIVIVGPLNEIESVKDEIKSRYQCTDGKEVNWLLKLKLKHSYISELISELNLDNAVGIVTPISPRLTKTTQSTWIRRDMNDIARLWGR
jgi:hypothetical protein